MNLSELDSDSDVVFVENIKNEPVAVDETSNDSTDDNEPLALAIKRFKTEIPVAQSSSNDVQGQMQVPSTSTSEIGDASGLVGKYEHKKFYWRKGMHAYR